MDMKDIDLIVSKVGWRVFWIIVGLNFFFIFLTLLLGMAGAVPE